MALEQQLIIEKHEMKDFSFDYIYYRINQVYFKWDGRNGITSIIGVSMIQSLSFLDILLLIERFFYTRQEIVAFGNVKLVSWSFVGLFLILLFYNERKYKNKFNGFKKKWKDEELQLKRKKGFLVVVCMILPWIPLILLGIIK